MRLNVEDLIERAKIAGAKELLERSVVAESNCDADYCLKIRAAGQLEPAQRHDSDAGGPCNVLTTAVLRESQSKHPLAYNSSNVARGINKSIHI
jgi:hypothetical protein